MLGLGFQPRKASVQRLHHNDLGGHVARGGLGVGAQILRTLDELGGSLIVKIGQNYLNLALQAEGLAFRTERDAGAHLTLGQLGGRHALLLGGKRQRSLEAGAPADGEQLLGVRALTLAAHGDRRVQVELQFRLMAHGVAVAAARNLRRSGVDDLRWFVTLICAHAFISARVHARHKDCPTVDDVTSSTL